MTPVIVVLIISFFPPELGPWYSRCSRGDWPAAADLAEELVSSDTACVGALPALVIAGSMDPGRRGSDLPDLLSPDTFSSLYSTAMGTLLMTGSGSFIEDAESRLMEAVRLDPGNTLAWYFLGRLKVRLGSTAAESCLARAVSLDPGFLPAGLEEARLRRDRGDGRGALLRFLELWETSSPAGELALAEYVLLADSMGMHGVSDSMLALTEGLAPGVWYRLAREQMDFRPELALRAAERIQPLSIDLALLLLDLGDTPAAAEASSRLLASGNCDSTGVMVLLGTSLFQMNEDGEAKEVFLHVLDRDPLSVAAMVHLGRIAERSGSTGDAVDHYLMALERDPFNAAARERLREIADDSYDPEIAAVGGKGFSVTAGADLSVERGSRSLLEWGGSASVSYHFDGRGTSIDGSVGGRSVTWEESRGFRTDTLNTNRGWAGLGFDYWFSDSWYVQAASSWDRQMYTERPWQLSSYGALGWQKWMLTWFWFSPRLGVGSVNTRWTTGRQDIRTDDFSIFAAAGLMYSKPHTFIRRAEISGDLYFPPDDPGNFISSGNISLAFRTWSPLYFSVGYSVDYTRSPEVSTWNKFNTSFTTSVNLDLY